MNCSTSIHQHKRQVIFSCFFRVTCNILYFSQKSQDIRLILIQPLLKSSIRFILLDNSQFYFSFQRKSQKPTQVQLITRRFIRREQIQVISIEISAGRKELHITVEHKRQDHYKLPVPPLPPQYCSPSISVSFLNSKTSVIVSVPLSLSVSIILEN